MLKYLYQAETFDNVEIIGFIFAMRENLPRGCKGRKIEYYLIVNDITMPSSVYRGMFKVKEGSIKAVL